MAEPALISGVPVFRMYARKRVTQWRKFGWNSGDADADPKALMGLEGKEGVWYGDGHPSPPGEGSGEGA